MSTKDESKHYQETRDYRYFAEPYIKEFAFDWKRSHKQKFKYCTGNLLFESGEIYYPHTLNGSSLAIGRLLISILENYQNEDGTIKIPSILKDYTNGLSIISNDKKI